MNIIHLRPRATRAIVLFGCLSLVLFGYVLRLTQLQVFQHKAWASRSENNHISKRTLAMKRGTIAGRGGVEFALSVETYNVFIFTREMKDLRESAELVASVLPMTTDEIMAKVEKRSGYIPIYKNLDRSLAMKVTKLNIPGVRLEEHYRRVYPQKSLASNIVGFTGTDGHGLEGMEYLMESTLRGYAGLAVQEDISLSEDRPNRMRIIRPPMGGNNLVLTIDSFIQHILESELATMVDKYSPIDATAIVMDPHTGEILGMACLPNYDLNRFSEYPLASHRDRPVVDTFEPGSCMKIFAVAAAIKAGKANESTRFYCRGYGELAGRRVRCHGSHGLVDLNRAIAQSCNASLVQISQMLEPAELYRLYTQAGFGSITGVELPGESAGTLFPPSKWSGFSAASLCFGQELSTTGIQLVAGYCAIANGGKLMKPRIIKQITSQTGKILEVYPPKVVRTIFSAKLAAWLRRMLFGVVETGTGKLVELKDYTVGGKTSTAQKAEPKKGYSKEKVVASFIGMAPALDPKIVLLVAANEPNGDENTLYGGQVAGPAFARITDRILKYMKIPPDKKQSFTITAPIPKQKKSGSSLVMAVPFAQSPATSVSTHSANIAGESDLIQAMPNFRGITLKEVAQQIKKIGVKAIFNGNGIAIDQTPQPGEPIPETRIVIIKFSATRD